MARRQGLVARPRRSPAGGGACRGRGGGGLAGGGAKADGGTRRGRGGARMEVAPRRMAVLVGVAAEVGWLEAALIGAMAEVG